MVTLFITDIRLKQFQNNSYIIFAPSLMCGAVNGGCGHKCKKII